MKNKKILRLALAGILVAVGVVTSPFYIPVGAARCFPIQHMINVIAAVLLGPCLGTGMAFSTSLIRVLMGTGSFLAFPGSMCGALLSGIAYKYTQKKYMAYAGELVGTGIIGSLVAYPVALLLMGNESAALFGFVVPFMLSTVGGVVIAGLILKVLDSTGVLSSMKKKVAVL